jgi:hypothetical protein
MDESDIVDILCMTVHRFVTGLVGTCYERFMDGNVDLLGMQDKKNVYSFRDMDIFGYTEDQNVLIFFPENLFPLPEEDYSRMEKSFKQLGFGLINDPEELFYKPEWAYSLRFDGDKKYVANGISTEIAVLRPVEGGDKSELLLYLNKIKHNFDTSYDIVNTFMIYGLANLE